MPFAFGQVFRKGAALPGEGLSVANASAQVSAISTWDDGSIKHALVAGTTNLASGSAQSLSIAKGSATSGAALGEAQLIAANPQATVSYGSYGTVSLASLLGTSARVVTEHAGPQYAAFQYMASFPSDANVRAVFYVQLWSGGKYRVRVAVENGASTTSTAGKSGTATVTVAGTTVHSGSVSMPAGTRWDAVGSNVPVAAVAHDAAYLRASKLVPNYGWRNASSSTLSSLPANYTPMARLSWEPDMGAAGFQPAIGLLPQWDSLYAATGDARAANSALAHARAYGSYSVFYRSTSTRAMPLFSSAPTAVNGGDQEGMNALGSNAIRWEVAHHPNAGYLAWLITAERFHLETLQANAWAAWFTDSGGSGTGRLYSSQTRARAWRYRTIASAAAVSPDGDAFKGEARANIVANLNRWRTNHVVPNNPATGLGATYDDQDSAAGLQRSLFEHLFLASSIGWSFDQEMQLGATDLATLAQVRDYFYRIPIGLAGRGAAQGEFSWRHGPGPYRTTVGPTASSYYADWGQVYSATYGSTVDTTAGLPLIGNYADDPSSTAFPQGNWGHLLSALSFAADHRVAGATEGFQRITGASNWNANATKFNDWPQYGLLPR